MRRILQIGLGPLGRMIVLDIARRAAGEVVAAVDIDPAMAGTSLARAVPESGFDVPIRQRLDQIEDWRGIDAAIVSTCSDLARCADTLRALLRRGVPVVSTCEELLYPWLRHRALAEELHALAVRHGGGVLGTGVNPGFIMDTLAVGVTAVCRDVRRVRVSRIQDAGTRRVPFQQKIGAGLDEVAFQQRVADGSLRHVGLGESLHFLAEYIGLAVGRWTETLEPVWAERDLACALGPISRGRAAGVRQVARGWAPGAREDDAPVIGLEFQAAIGQAEPRDEIVLDAEPPVRLVIPGGVHGDVATVAITVNAIPSLLAAGPGLHTMATVPLVRFAAAAR